MRAKGDVAVKLNFPGIRRDGASGRFDTSELEAALVGAAADLAERWLAMIPQAEEVLQAGDQLVLEVSLAPKQSVALFLVSGEGTRSLLASRHYPAATLH